jgi:DNA-binding beta-propeller fold protein YncE
MTGKVIQSVTLSSAPPVRPKGVTVTGRGDLYIAEELTDRILVFDHNIRPVRVIGESGVHAREKLCKPSGVAIDGSGRVIVAEWKGDRVSVFSNDGQFLSCIGSDGPTVHHLSGPCGVAVSSKGDVIIAEYYNNRVNVFDSSYRHVRMIGLGILSGPHALCVWGPHDRIVVTDTDHHRIVIFELDGTEICQFGSSGSGLGQFRFPKGVAVSNDGVLFVTSTHMIQAFQMVEH